ncbi:twin-arginine translocase TatA/TatE family subunit [uncultured Campylobacter sp.]|uniref:twin-arginine translocase TatA/TatE family subunit n=1 Tax=uncultured Campylobacter sp. TaxID=218934 RepID=UPI00262C991E|nr:twin-arginine translocase TatA/TatE family subunit [uncultured Campylobacter sp.]
MAVGPWQVVVILAIIILLFGGKKIPELAKGLGKGIKSFKNELESSDEAKAEIKDDKPKSSEAVNKEQKEA